MMSALLEDAARNLLSSAMLGGDWVGALEPIMTEMNAMGGGPSRIVPPDLFAIPTSGVRELFRDFKAGDRPKLTRGILIPAAARDLFVADYMAPTYAMRQRHPFYNEFLRPRHACHQAAAFLDETAAGPVRLMVYRNERQGPFQTEELREFGRILPYLRSTAMLSRGSINAMARRQAEPFDQRGEPVLFLGPDGRLLETNAAGERAVRATLVVVRGRLTTFWPAEQPRLDRALNAAIIEGRPALATVHASADDAPIMALALPVAGDAKDVFHTTSAVVVLIDPTRRQSADDAVIGLLEGAADLTPREVAVVRLVGTGRSPKDAALDLGINYSTARSHLKASFAKLGVHTQAELVTLIHRLR